AQTPAPDPELAGLLCQALGVGCPKESGSMWAHVDGDGSLLAGSHATAARKFSPNDTAAYVVSFDRPIDGCAAVASPGFAKTFESEKAGIGFGHQILLGVPDPPIESAPYEAFINWAPGSEGQTLHEVSFFLIVTC
ncbi:MAG: hypothetical protein ACREQJ_13750, partial [Candidatus Binatia bacterium]